jgi:hypothetical protein
MHADEIMYLFTMPIPHNETEKELSKKMIEIWTTFATYGQVKKIKILRTSELFLLNNFVFQIIV